MGERMWCHSCREKYESGSAGTCKECYEEARETEEELKREIDDLKAKISFLRLPSPVDPHLSASSSSALTSDLTLHACSADSPPIPAHKAVLMSRSPVFKAMLESDMEETRSNSIKIADASYPVLRIFVHYLYTAEALLDEAMACELLILAEKYQVKNLKAFCEKFIVSKVNSNTALMTYAFGHQYNAKTVTEAALALIMDDMGSIAAREEYRELVEKDPRLVVGIYEAYLSKQLKDE